MTQGKVKQLVRREGSGMESQANTKVKVVWIEGDEPHCITAVRQGEKDSFLTFTLTDGRMLYLQKSMVVKIEEVTPQ